MKFNKEDLIRKFFWIFIILCAWAIWSMYVISLNNKVEQPIPIKTEVVKPIVKTDWDLLKEAIIFVESGGNDTIVGTKCDVGCIQATPIYVKEVNRIAKLKNIDKKYTLADRKNREKCMEMFDIIQAHHNPEKDLFTAIKLHNPKAGDWYYNKVSNRLNYLRSIQN